MRPVKPGRRKSISTIHEHPVHLLNRVGQLGHPFPKIIERALFALPIGSLGHADLSSPALQRVSIQVLGSNRDSRMVKELLGDETYICSGLIALLYSRSPSLLSVIGLWRDAAMRPSALGLFHPHFHTHRSEVLVLPKRTLVSANCAGIEYKRYRIRVDTSDHETIIGQINRKRVSK